MSCSAVGAAAARQEAAEGSRRPPEDARSLVLCRLGLISRLVLGIVHSLRSYHGEDWIGLGLVGLGAMRWGECLGASAGHRAVRVVSGRGGLL